MSWKFLPVESIANGPLWIKEARVFFEANAALTIELQEETVPVQTARPGRPAATTPPGPPGDPPCRRCFKGGEMVQFVSFSGIVKNHLKKTKQAANVW